MLDEPDFLPYTEVMFNPIVVGLSAGAHVISGISGYLPGSSSEITTWVSSAFALGEYFINDFFSSSCVRLPIIL